MKEQTYIEEFIEYTDSINFTGYCEEILSQDPEYLLGQYYQFVEQYMN